MPVYGKHLAGIDILLIFSLFQKDKKQKSYNHLNCEQDKMTTMYSTESLKISEIPSKSIENEIPCKPIIIMLLSLFTSLSP